MEASLEIDGVESDAGFKRSWPAHPRSDRSAKLILERTTACPVARSLHGRKSRLQLAVITRTPPLQHTLHKRSNSSHKRRAMRPTLGPMVREKPFHLSVEKFNITTGQHLRKFAFRCIFRSWVVATYHPILILALLTAGILCWRGN